MARYLLFGSSVVLSSTDGDINEVSKKTWKDTFLSYFNKEKIVENDRNSVKENNPVSLTGWDRLYIMYTRDEFGYMSKELNTILYSSYTSFIFGGIYGMATSTKTAYHDFLDRNQATQFANVFEARRKMQDKVLIAGLKGFFTHGLRLAFFTGGILACTISLMVYFQKNSFLFYGVSGGTFGVIHRWKYGPKGMLVGGAIGGILGLTAGGLTKGLFVLADKSLDDVITYQDSVVKEREKLLDEILKKDKENKIKTLSLLKDHEELALLKNENESAITSDVPSNSS